MKTILALLLVLSSPAYADSYYQFIDLGEGQQGSIIEIWQGADTKAPWVHVHALNKDVDIYCAEFEDKILTINFLDNNSHVNTSSMQDCKRLGRIKVSVPKH